MDARPRDAKAENCCYENYVAQRYLDDPYLVGGKKFDMRLYAVCLSYNPLKVYLYREGFARFTNARYSMSKADIDNPYVHLTNHAIQKKDEAYDAETTDLKWSIGELKRFMTTKHGAEAVNACFAGIQSIIVNSLRSVSNVIINDKHCFEMYGYDVMLDADLKPWLIEVNASPSMSSDTQTDHDLKFGLLDDMLTVVDVENHFAGRAPRPRGRVRPDLRERRRSARRGVRGAAHDARHAQRQAGEPEAAQEVVHAEGRDEGGCGVEMK